MSRPYAEHARGYWAAGWHGVLPLPAGKKHPPPEGWTGRGKPYPSFADVVAWAEERPAANIGLRLPPGVLGIDVDAYGDKPGAATLAQLETECGPAPATVMVTSREDGTSGIRLYRVPEDFEAVGNLPGVELIQPHHRYAVLAPSVHPEGRAYRIIHTDGTPGDLPAPGDLPELPATWLERLRASNAGSTTKDDLDDEQTKARIAAWCTAGDPCPHLARALDKARAALKSGKARHDTCRDHQLALIRLGEAGHPGAATALVGLLAAWNAALAGSRDGRGEWTRGLNGAIALVAADPTPEAFKGCDDTTSTKDTPKVEPITFAEAHATFTRWLGADYDLELLDVFLATLAAERLPGDPCWLLIISGSGNAKTETVQAARGVGALIVSTIASEAALLSGTPKHERAKNATGGLLRQVGTEGVLVVKDVTSILSAHRDQRAQILAALREVHDGHWVRNVGTEGGQSLTWMGRIAVIGAVTTAWDQAHDVIATMGDRFVLVRADSAASGSRVAAGRKAMRNTGEEKRMRAELAGAVAGVLAGLDTAADLTLTDAEVDRILAAADVVTRARTGVIYDYRGDVVDAHAPEMPTRFAKQLTQVVRGAVALGMSRAYALYLAIRCARDSMPPLRLAILLDVAAHPASTTTEVRKRLGKPRATVDRQLQALDMLDVLDCDEDGTNKFGNTVWRYSVATGINPDVLDPGMSPEMSPHTPYPPGRESRDDDEPDSPRVPPDISGDMDSAGQAPPPQPRPAEPPPPLGAVCVDCGWPLTSKLHHASCGTAADDTTAA